MVKGKELKKPEFVAEYVVGTFRCPKCHKLFKVIHKEPPTKSKTKGHYVEVIKHG